MPEPNIRYYVSVAFAVLVFGAAFYGTVLSEYELDDLKTGALISLMTLAAQYVFAEAVGTQAGRRAMQSFESGQRAANPPDNAGAVPPADDGPTP